MADPLVIRVHLENVSAGQMALLGEVTANDLAEAHTGLADLFRELACAMEEEEG